MNDKHIELFDVIFRIKQRKRASFTLKVRGARLLLCYFLINSESNMMSRKIFRPRASSFISGKMYCDFAQNLARKIMQNRENENFVKF